MDDKSMFPKNILLKIMKNVVLKSCKELLKILIIMMT